LFCYGAKDWEVLDVPIPPDQGARIRNVPRPWVDSLLNDTPPTATAQDGRVALELILGAYQSAREGRRITFPLDA
jgi:predicted dehydrogenase